MEIIYSEEHGKLFGTTNLIGIGKRQPKLIYGEQAKKLREEKGLSTLELSKEFDVRENVIIKLENQTISLDEKLLRKYMLKFGVNKDYFFDLDLETLILVSDGHIVKEFDTSEKCKKAFDDLQQKYFEGLRNNAKYIEIDFSKM